MNNNMDQYFYMVVVYSVSMLTIWNNQINKSILLKQKYKIKTSFNFTIYLHYNAIKIFIEHIFKYACIFLI